MTTAPAITQAAPPLQRITLRSLLPLALAFAAFKVVLHIIANVVSQHAGYGIFRDEMYYLICGQRLALGYVDQPPMVALQARLTQALFGVDHMWSLRLLAALAGGVKVLLTALLVRALGGGRAAAGLAMFAVIAAPVYLSIDSFLSMNSFEPVFWMGAVLGLVEIARLEREGLAHSAATRNWWVVVGVSAGLGLENKATLVFYLAALLVALLLTPARRILATRPCALGIALIVVLALPNLYWQATNHFPTWEWLQDVAHSDKVVHHSVLAQLGSQFLVLGPLNSILWLAGLAWLLFARVARGWRFVAVAYLLFLAYMVHMQAKDYYLVPAYPVLFAAGAVAAVRWAAARRLRGALVWSYVALLFAGTVVFVPYALPVLPPARFLAYEDRIGFHPEDVEKHDATPLPQFYADRFGWTDLIGKVSAVYNSLPADERARTGIFARNYGEASAINLYGPRLGLPTAISGHQNYWIWGPSGYTGEEMILIVQDSREQLNQYYESCTLKAQRNDPLAMPWERGPIYLCKGRKTKLFAEWNDFKEYR